MLWVELNLHMQDPRGWLTFQRDSMEACDQLN